MSKAVIVIFLACGLLSKEVHRFFSNRLRPETFPLDPGYLTSPAWHISFITARIFTLMAVTALWYREYRTPRNDRHFVRILGLFPIYCILDLLAYFLYHGTAGIPYFCTVFTPLIIYVIYYLIKRKKS